jgi:hypothetical protein
VKQKILFVRTLFSSPPHKMKCKTEVIPYQVGSFVSNHDWFPDIQIFFFEIRSVSMWITYHIVSTVAFAFAFAFVSLTSRLGKPCCIFQLLCTLWMSFVRIRDIRIRNCHVACCVCSNCHFIINIFT